jgi:hypothetical protein
MDVNFSEEWLDIQINKTDCVYVFGYYLPNHKANGVLCSFVTSPDYKHGFLRHVIVEGGISIGHNNKMIGINASGDFFIMWRASLDDLYRVFFSYQIPLTPDLSVNNTGFRIREVRGAREPINVSAMVKNVGRAVSRSHWIELSYSLEWSDAFEMIVDRRMEVVLEPNRTCNFEHAFALPQGNCLLRLRVHDVTPYENNVGNNVFNAWFFVSNNNPPTIQVYQPEDGSTLHDTLILSGVTEDLDIGGQVTTSVTGLPSITIEFNGAGSWNRTLDLGVVPSGVYILSFQAYDGRFFSEVVYRRVRVARDNDTLKLLSFHPRSDVTLIEGEEQLFFFNASDPLVYVLDYQWRIDSGLWIRGSSYYLFEAEVAGIYRLEVNVSNGFKWLSRVWNITVLELIPPSIGSYTPDRPSVTLVKREGVEFSIAVVNPHRQPYTIIWTLEGKVITGEDIHKRSFAFDMGGNHTLSVGLFTTLTQETVSWALTVTNEAPVIETWSPTNLTVVIEREGEVVFEVSAFDPDGDALFYNWSLGGDPLADQCSPSSRILLPCIERTPYTVEMRVCDGETTTVLQWMVRPEPVGPPSASDSVPWVMVAAVLLALVMAACLAVFSYRYIRQQRD